MQEEKEKNSRVVKNKYAGTTGDTSTVLNKS
jgi:hypothetical protein